MTSTDTVPTYAVAYLRDVDVNDRIVAYLRAIDATLAPYGGRFLVHGGRLTALEGEWDGDLVVIAFPGRREAQEWYDSPAYQEILPFRLDHSTSIAALVDGVVDDYRATDKLEVLLA